jgi:hypothetical protein
MRDSIVKRLVASVVRPKAESSAFVELLIECGLRACHDLLYSDVRQTTERSAMVDLLTECDARLRGRLMGLSSSKTRKLRCPQRILSTSSFKPRAQSTLRTVCVPARQVPDPVQFRMSMDAACAAPYEIDYRKAQIQMLSMLL